MLSHHTDDRNTAAEFTAIRTELNNKIERVYGKLDDLRKDAAEEFASVRRENQRLAERIEHVVLFLISVTTAALTFALLFVIGHPPH